MVWEGKVKKRDSSFLVLKHSLLAVAALGSLIVLLAISSSTRRALSLLRVFPFSPSSYPLAHVSLLLLKQCSFLSPAHALIFPLSLSFSLFLFCWSYSSSSRFFAMYSLVSWSIPLLPLARLLSLSLFFSLLLPHPPYCLFILLAG